MNKHARTLTCPLTCCRLRDRCRYAVGVSFVSDELTQKATPPTSPAHAQQKTVEHTSYQLYASFPEFRNAFLVDRAAFTTLPDRAPRPLAHPPPTRCQIRRQQARRLRDVSAAV